MKYIHFLLDFAHLIDDVCYDKKRKIDGFNFEIVVIVTHRLLEKVLMFDTCQLILFNRKELLLLRNICK